MEFPALHHLSQEINPRPCSPHGRAAARSILGGIWSFPSQIPFARCRINLSELPNALFSMKRKISWKGGVGIQRTSQAFPHFWGRAGWCLIPGLEQLSFRTKDQPRAAQCPRFSQECQELGKEAPARGHFSCSQGISYNPEPGRKAKTHLISTKICLRPGSPKLLAPDGFWFSCLPLDYRKFLGNMSSAFEREPPSPILDILGKTEGIVQHSAGLCSALVPLGEFG